MGSASTLALVPAGTNSFGRRWPVKLQAKAGAAPVQRKSAPSRHMRWRMTDSFRATATFAFVNPDRFAMARPEACRAEGAADPGQDHIRRLVEMGAYAPVAALRHAPRAVHLARGVAPGRQAETGAHTRRLPEPRRLVDPGPDRERHHSILPFQHLQIVHSTESLRVPFPGG